jgi:preprotein translocase subunit SecG
MNFLIVLLTGILLLDCILLILLVLIQLPKKEAGMGLAFGSGATDALFGAGSGNALTQLTKYAAGVFFALVIILSVVAQGAFKRNTSSFEQGLKQEAAKLTETRATTASSNAPAAIAAGTNKAPALMSATNSAPAKP